MASTMAISRPKVGPRAQLAIRARRVARGGFLSCSVMVMIGRWTTSHRFARSDSNRAGDLGGLAST